MTTATLQPPRQRDARTPPTLPAIVELELAAEVAPSWLVPDMRLRVPVPPEAPSGVTAGHVLVWARLDHARRVPLVALGHQGLESAYPWSRWQEHVLMESYATWRRRPLHTRLPINYHIVPRKLRRILWGSRCRRRDVQRSAFPQPPFDGGFEALRAVFRQHGVRTSSPPAPRVCLTHDIDSAAGFRFVRRLAEVEAELGLRSCWNVVATGYRIDYGVCEWLIEQGHEIGLHGDRHDNKLIYLPEEAMRRRLDACRELMDRYGIRGFRSPSWLRNVQLMRVLADYVDYDCSCLDFDWRCVAGRGGVLTASPFRFGRLVEIPTTLPFEQPLVSGHTPEETVAWWHAKIDWLVGVGGQAVVNTHPDPPFSGNEPMIRAYGRFLEELLAAYDGRWSLPRDLAQEVRPDV